VTILSSIIHVEFDLHNTCRIWLSQKLDNQNVRCFEVFEVKDPDPWYWQVAFVQFCNWCLIISTFSEISKTLLSYRTFSSCCWEPLFEVADPNPRYGQVAYASIIWCLNHLPKVLGVLFEFLFWPLKYSLISKIPLQGFLLRQLSSSFVTSMNWFKANFCYFINLCISESMSKNCFNRNFIAKVISWRQHVFYFTVFIFYDVDELVQGQLLLLHKLVHLRINEQKLFQQKFYCKGYFMKAACFLFHGLHLLWRRWTGSRPTFATP